jgi:predicted ATP-dependent endonuclease of OLD family
VLRSLRVSGFRGVASAEVTFDRTTVLIGENDSGMSSLLEALVLALSPNDSERPRLEPDAFPRGGEKRPLSIELAFEKPAVTLTITASPPQSDQPVDAEWAISSPGAAPNRNDAAGLAAIRRSHPLLRFQHGARTGAEFASRKQRIEEWFKSARPAPRMRAMVTDILGDGGRANDQPESEVHPILLIEKPEAELHPMTLALLGSLLEQSTHQKIVTTHSGALLSAVPLQAIRRLVRDTAGVVRERRIGRESMTRDEQRKVGYHLRARRSIACFARTWLLVEGETEFWLMPDLARLCGHDFAQEGVAVVEFAQCGLVPLIKFANSLGITWHVLTDGDRAGGVYSDTVRPFLAGADRSSRLTRLEELDIEHCFWQHGYQPVFERLARMDARGGTKPTVIIRKAIERNSKPAVAFELLSAVAARGSEGPPPPLKDAIETCVRLARGTELNPKPKPRRERRPQKPRARTRSHRKEQRL